MAFCHLFSITFYHFFIFDIFSFLYCYYQLSTGTHTHTHAQSRITHVLPLLSDEWSVSKEVFQREVVDVRPGGGAVPGYLQPPSVETDRGRRHTLRGVGFDCGVDGNK